MFVFRNTVEGGDGAYIEALALPSVPYGNFKCWRRGRADDELVPRFS